MQSRPSIAPETIDKMQTAGLDNGSKDRNNIVEVLPLRAFLSRENPENIALVQ